MNVVAVIVAALQAIAEIAINPVLGLSDDAVRVSALVGTVASLGSIGPAAIPELESFTAEIKHIGATGAKVDPGVWDALTARRHADFQALLALKGD